jgi:hypothetical protein
MDVIRVAGRATEANIIRGYPHPLASLPSDGTSKARGWLRRGQLGHILVGYDEWMNPLSRHFGAPIAADMLLLEVSTGRW